MVLLASVFYCRKILKSTMLHMRRVQATLLIVALALVPTESVMCYKCSSLVSDSLEKLSEPCFDPEEHPDVLQPVECPPDKNGCFKSLDESKPLGRSGDLEHEITFHK